MDAEFAIERARSAIGAGCKYDLGRGGRKPEAKVPWDSRKRCDCSGFTAWVLGFDRKTDEPFYVNHNSGWVNTTAMWVDAEEPVGIFRQIVRPRAGALLVYPGKGRSKGHVGIITKVVEGRPVQVVHCASSNYRLHGDAILENSASILLKHPKHRFIWYEGMRTNLQMLHSDSERFS